MKTLHDEDHFFHDLFDMLEAHLGKDTGLMLRSVSDNNGNTYGIIDTRNDHIFDLKLDDEHGSSVSEAICQKKEPVDFSNSFVHTASGRILKHSSACISDSEGNPIGEICMDGDITRAVEAEKFLRDYNMYRICSGGGIYPTDIASVLDDFIQEALLYIGIPVSEMKRKDKIRFVQYLDSKGVFLVLKSSTKICKLLNISKYTLYNYLGRSNKEEKNLADN